MRYLLEGAVRRLGEKVEINAQLISTETGAHVWADRFEGERGKLGELQLEVVSRLANSLGVELVKAEALRAARERPSNPDAVDLAMQAEVKEHSYASDRKASINEAVALSERALALDPQNLRALTVRANALLDRESDYYSDDPAGDIARAEKTIDAALALQPDSSSVHLAKSNLYFEKHQWGPSIAEAETAVAENPNNAAAYASAGFNRLFLGRSEEGFTSVETAFRLSPRDPRCALLAILYVPPPRLSGAVGAGDPMVRQGGSGRSAVLYHLSTPRLRQRLGRPRQGSKGSRRAIAESLSRLHRAGLVGHPLERRSDLQRAISAHRRGPAQGGRARG